MSGASPTGRAFVPAASDPQAVPPVPASIPDALALERPARAIAAAKRGVRPNIQLIDKVWPTYVGQARAAIMAFLEGAAVIGRAGERLPWIIAPASGLERAIDEFKAALPGWWFTVGECQVSADASCGPTRESPDIELIAIDSRFDDGFHADLPQPATMADALRDVLAQAIEARRAATSGAVHESAVPEGDAPKAPHSHGETQ